MAIAKFISTAWLLACGLIAVPRVLSLASPDYQTAKEKASAWRRALRGFFKYVGSPSYHMLNLDMAAWSPSVQLGLTIDWEHLQAYSSSVSDLHHYLLNPLQQCVLRDDGNQVSATNFHGELKVDSNQEASEGERPNFCGRWILARIDGEPDKVAYNAGLSKAKRMASAALGWGVGAVSAHIVHEGAHLQLTTSTPLGQGRADFQIGAGIQTGMASDGVEYECDPVWVGAAIASNNLRGGVHSTQRRFLQDGCMIMETVIDGYYQNARLIEVYERY